MKPFRRVELGSTFAHRLTLRNPGTDPVELVPGVPLVAPGQPLSFVGWQDVQLRILDNGVALPRTEPLTLAHSTSGTVPVGELTQSGIWYATDRTSGQVLICLTAEDIARLGVGIWTVQIAYISPGGAPYTVSVRLPIVVPGTC